MDDVSRELKAFLDYVVGKRSDDVFVKKLEEAVEEAKKNREWRLEFMTLLMRDQENYRKGKEEGKEEGIYGAISMCRDFNLSEAVILQKLQEKFHLSEEEAKKYIDEVY